MESSDKANVKDICILGSGGHGQSTLGLIAELIDYNFLGFFDDFAQQDSFVLDVFPILGSIQDLLLTKHASTKVAIGIGYSLEQRATFFDDLISLDSGLLPTLIHPSALIDQKTQLSLGSHIHAGGIIRIGAHIGVNVVVNSGAIIEHHASVGPHSIVSPGSVICGRVKVGAGTFIGAGATILPEVSIGDSCLIGAGALVLEDVPHNMMCVGNPGRIMPVTLNAKKILGGEL